MKDIDEPGTDIVIPHIDDLPAAFADPAKIDEILADITRQVQAHTFDATTPGGRKKIASLAYKVARSKTALDDAGKGLTDDMQKAIGKINADRRRIRDSLDQLRDNTRRPVDEWERIEGERIDRHKAGVAAILQMAPGSDDTAEVIRQTLSSIRDLDVGERWEEFEGEAARAKAEVVERFDSALTARKTYEAEQAELARLRAEAEERRLADEQAARDREEADRKARVAAAAEAARELAAREQQEAVERARKEAEEAGQREIAAAKQREEEAEQRAASARREVEVERERAAIREKAAADAERARAAREREEAEAARAKREANTRNRAKAKAAMVEALIPALAGKTKGEVAAAVADALMTGAIPHMEFRL